MSATAPLLNRDKSAFPVVGMFSHPDDPGMTLRDYFAAQVLDMCSHDLTEPELVAQRAYAIADAMLAEREKVL